MSFVGAEAPCGLFTVFDVNDVAKASVFFHICNFVVASNATTFFIHKRVIFIQCHNDAVAKTALVIYVLNPEAGFEDSLEGCFHNLLS